MVGQHGQEFTAIEVQGDYVAHNNDVFITSAHAMKKGKNILNDIIQSSYTISLDKDFIYAGTVIKANTNLFSIPSINKEISVSKNEWAYLFSSQHRVFKFTRTFNDNIAIAEGVYKIFFSCQTTQNEIFKDSIQVYINH
jgi:hypothetical protein